jgi:hypothetical protein
MIENQLTVFLVNKPGVLANVCKALAAKKVNIRALSVSDTVDHAVVRMVVSDPRTAVHVLGDHGALVVETEILAVPLSDQVGELAKLAARLAQAKINIEYAYGSTGDSNATIFVRVSDLKKAMSLLGPKKSRRK